MTENEIVQAFRALSNSSAPASPEAVAQVEEVIGHPLPPLLRRLYLEVANGGFGPRDGILGVACSEHEHHSDVADILEIYESTRDEWPGMLWLFDWGDGIWSVVEFRDPAGPVWVWDPNIDDSDLAEESPLSPQNMVLAEWLTESLDGNLEKAFETGGLVAVSERRAAFDVRPGELEYDPPDPLTDDEIIGAMSRLPGTTATASPAAVDEAERAMGLRLPPLLRRVYLEVANGGLGPGGGILGVPVTGTAQPADVVECHAAWNAGPDPFVPSGLVWLCDWGSAIWSLVDCRDPAGPMWLWDPMGPYLSSDAVKSVDRTSLVAQNMTLAEWLTEWLNGSFGADSRPSTLRAVAARRSGQHCETTCAVEWAEFGEECRPRSTTSPRRPSCGR
ncbi:SMI1/KNR4 family protein [Nonomuraea sp. NPDC059194]|uniref:SMI1/KNR4 family protein n=1 Tax=Nonomuraea sp. NPDC059194 TaxID=3346764 RepID=UPI0036CE7172